MQKYFRLYSLPYSTMTKFLKSNTTNENFKLLILYVIKNTEYENSGNFPNMINLAT